MCTICDDAASSIQDGNCHRGRVGVVAAHFARGSPGIRTAFSRDAAARVILHPTRSRHPFHPQHAIPTSSYALRERAARLGANGLLLLNTRGTGGVRGAGTGVIIGGPSDGHVIVGSVETEVDDFERAVAIRYRAAPAVSSTPR